MTDLCFVDTNVLVYARDASEPEKQSRAQHWLTTLWERQCGRTGIQVLNEYFVTTTRKLKPGLSEDEAWQDIEDLFAWKPMPADERVMRIARSLSADYSISWWDALIAGAAQGGNCAYLLTEDLQHDLDLEGVRVLDPFRILPEEVLPSY